jgi:hypothetical protein
MNKEDKEPGIEPSPSLAFDMTLALYLDLVAVLEKAGVVTYRQMAARVLNISMNAHADGNAELGEALEGIARGFGGQEDGISIALLKMAGDLRDDEAFGDVPLPPQEP